MTQFIDVGIDLGTTNSCIAKCEGGNIRIFPNKQQMNVTPSAPPAGGHSDGGASNDSACGASTSARRLAALSLRGPVGESTVLTPACANSFASVSAASSIDGNRNGRPDCKHARISAIASGDFFARIPIGRSAGRLARSCSMKALSAMLRSSP